MQVVILAAGSSTRFYPLNTTHKAGVTLLGKTILEHTLMSVKKAGFTDVILVVNPKDGFQEIIGDGTSLDLRITYIMQDDPKGAGEALLLAKEIITDDFFVIWGSRIEFHEFSKDLLEKKQNESGVILVKETENIEGVGVVTVSDGKLIDIIEKPQVVDASSHLKIIGVYLLPKQFLQTLQAVPSQHYSFEHALVTFAKTHILECVITEKETLSLKYPWDLLQVKDYLLKQIATHKEKNVEIGANVVIEGTVFIEEGAKIMENAVIKGPCYIGKKAFIGTNSILRGGTVIEENVVVGANMEIKNSIFFPKTTTHSGFIGDSIIGAKSKIAANFCTANVRLDRTSIHVKVGGKEVNTHLKWLGMIVGERAKIGIRVSTMPGILIGKNVTIGPQTTVMKDIEDNTKYYAKFSEVVEKKS